MQDHSSMTNSTYCSQHHKLNITSPTWQTQLNSLTTKLEGGPFLTQTPRHDSLNMTSSTCVPPHCNPNMTDPMYQTRRATPKTTIVAEPSRNSNHSIPAPDASISTWRRQDDNLDLPVRKTKPPIISLSATKSTSRSQHNLSTHRSQFQMRSRTIVAHHSQQPMNSTSSAESPT